MSCDECDSRRALVHTISNDCQMVQALPASFYARYILRVVLDLYTINHGSIGSLENFLSDLVKYT